VRQSKDNVDIGDGQKFTLPSHNPLVASAALTLWAMAITATVIGGGAIAAARALVAMPAEYRGTAASNRAQYFPMDPMEPTEFAVDEAIAFGANDIGHLDSLRTNTRPVERTEKWLLFQCHKGTGAKPGLAKPSVPWPKQGTVIPSTVPKHPFLPARLYRAALTPKSPKSTEVIECC
jgi:hypothetical protein